MYIIKQLIIRLHCLYQIIFYLNSVLLDHFLMIHLLKPTAIMIITFIVSFQGQSGTGTLYQVAFVLVQMFNYLKITVSQLLEMVDRCHLFIFFIIIYLIFL